MQPDCGGSLLSSSSVSRATSSSVQKTNAYVTRSEGYRIGGGNNFRVTGAQADLRRRRISVNSLCAWRERTRRGDIRACGAHYFLRSTGLHHDYRLACAA